MEFKKDKTHLAMVTKIVREDEDRDPFIKCVGVLTLEDILEQII